MAFKQPILIDQGSTFYTEIQLQDDAGAPIALAGYTCASEIRKHYTSSNSIAFETVLLTNSTFSAIVLKLDANTTNSIEPGRYLYDVELTDSSNVVSRVVEGIVTVTPNITRT